MDGSKTNVHRSVEDCLKALKGTKAIDIFECARVGPHVPIKETIRALAALQENGRIRAIGLSEVSASSIRRAVAIASIAVVEVELSLSAIDILYNGIATTCEDLNIPILAYGALSRGAFTGKTVRTNAQIPDGDHRKHLPKFQDDVLEQNNKLVDEIEKLANRKGCTMPQIAVSWVLKLSGGSLRDGTNLGTIIPLRGTSSPERGVENIKTADLTEADMEELWNVIQAHPVLGARYPAAFQKYSEY